MHCDDPQLKQGLKEHMLSKPFQNAFRSMVNRTIRSGMENYFDVYQYPSGYKFWSRSVKGNKSPDSIKDRILGDSVEDEDRNDDDYDKIAKVANKGDFSDFIGIHTHPYHPDDADSGFFVPSPQDVETASRACFDMLVPVNVITRDILIVVFQPINALSHVAYEGLWDEAFGGVENASVFLKLAAERSILRVIQIAKKQPLLTEGDVNLIIEAMEIK